jgi:hypothetical protein
VYVNHLKHIAATLYTPESPGAPPDSMPFSLYVRSLVIVG